MYFSIDEKNNIIDLSDKGREFLSPSEPENFVIPDIGDGFHKIEQSNTDSKKLHKKKSNCNHCMLKEVKKYIQSISF